MKTARSVNLEGAVIGRLVTIVRGERHFTLPARELGDLFSLLQMLGQSVGDEESASVPVARATPDVPTEGARQSLPSVVTGPVAVVSAAATAPIARRPGRPRRQDAAGAPAAKSTQRRGRVWEGIQDLLGREGPQSRQVILEMVIRNGLTDRDPDHATKIAIGKKLSAGEIISLSDGRIGLPGGRPAASKRIAYEDAAPDSDAGDKKRHRPGALWQSLKAYLGDFPGGLTEAEIVRAAAQHGWTSANDPSHAVKICLSRVREHLTRFGNRIALAGMTPPAPEPTLPTVRRRKRSDSESAAEESAAPSSPAPSAPASEPGTEVDPPWKGYPIRRRNRDF